MRSAVTFLAILIVPAVAFSDTLIVPDDYGTIQGAIDAAANGDTVIVKPGTYVENIDFLGKGITVMSDQGPDVTIIDGDHAGSVVTCQSGEDESSVLNGFTAIHGEGNSFNGDDCGGGMFMDSSSPMVMNCIFKENKAAFGGGIYTVDGNPEITGCTIRNNLAYWGSPHGGGGGDGGGIFNHGSSPIIADCTFASNFARYRGGGMCNRFGSHPTVTGCTFVGNSTHVLGGGMCNDQSSPVVTGCIFAGNWAEYGDDGEGGGMYNTDSSNPTVTSCLFSGNFALWGGGGMHNGYSSPEIMNCTFVGNKTLIQGGGMTSLWYSQPKVTNSVFWDNSAPEGPEIWIGGTYDPSTLSINHTVLKDGQSSIHVDPGCTLNWGPGNIDADPLYVVPGHWDENGTPGYPWDNFWVEGDYHLTFNSPCRASGDNSAVIEPFDFEGDPRIAYGTVDMGADEFYTHLYYTGDAAPGNSVELKLVELPGASPVGFWIALDALETPIPGAYGDWYLLPPMVGFFTMPPIPSDGVYVLPGNIPASPPGPYTLYLQAIMGTPAQLTNLCTMEVE